jgi:hypothetical protein
MIIESRNGLSVRLCSTSNCPSSQGIFSCDGALPGTWQTATCYNLSLVYNNQTFPAFEWVQNASSLQWGVALYNVTTCSDTSLVSSLNSSALVHVCAIVQATINGTAVGSWIV